MELTVFAKKISMVDATTKKEKSFTKFLAKLPRKTGDEQTVSVKFREECGEPKANECPCNIKIEKSDCNLVRSDFEKSDGSVYTSFTLWVSKWNKGAPYVDHSLDDFDF